MTTLPTDIQDATTFKFLQKRGTYQTEAQIAKALDCHIDIVRESLAQLEGFGMIRRHGTQLDQWVIDGVLDDALETVAKFEKFNKDKSIPIQLIELAEENVNEFFTDQYSRPHAAIKNNEHIEIYQIKSTSFRRWLAGLFWRTEGKAINSEGLNAALNVLGAKAAFEGKKRKLHNRVAWHGDAIYYDLSNEKWEAVKITPQGWEIVELPIIFKRYNHQKAQVTPISGGNFKELLRFTKIKSEDSRHLFLVDVIAKCIPEVPHPIDVVHGPQGSTKSTQQKILKELVDPSELSSLTFPRNNTELVQKLEHHYYANFDNVTELQKWQSDAICRACTGEGFSKRELFTDDDDVIYTYRRCVGVNGINVAGTSPDFLDRSILYELDRIAPSERIKEDILWTDFKRIKPKILGAIFDMVSEAMRIKPKLKLKELPRMADFAEWGEAISRALGYAPGVFLSTYFDSIKRVNIEAIEGHLIGPVVLTFMEDREQWEGTPAELYNKFYKIAEDIKINTNSKGWPKAANSLSRKLKELKTNLEEEGIEIIFDRKGPKGTRTLTISKKPSEPSDRQSPEPKTTDDTTDDIEQQVLISSDIPSEDLPRPTDDTDDTDDNLHTLGIPDTPQKLSNLLKFIFDDDFDQSRERWYKAKAVISENLSRGRIRPEVLQVELSRCDISVIEQDGIKEALGIKEVGAWLELSEEGVKILGVK